MSAGSSSLSDDRASVPPAPFGVGGPFEIDPALASRLLSIALAKGGAYADVFFELNTSAHFVVENGRLIGASRNVRMGMGVRVRAGDSTGYASSDTFEWGAMAHAARTAATIAGSGASRVTAVLSARAVPAYYDARKATIDAPGAAKRALLDRANQAAAAADRRVCFVEAGLSESVREILVATSDGRFVRDRQPLLRFGMRVLIDSEGRRQEGMSGGGGRTGLDYFATLSPEDHAAEAVRQASTMLAAREAPAGPMPVVLAPGDSGILIHEAVGHGLEADFNWTKSSRYAGKTGQLVASPTCTIVDDATVHGSRGSINVDDEGNEGRRNVLIEGGRLAGYLHDTRTASDFGASPTGNGRRAGYRSPPLPRMTSTLLLGGAHAPDEIVGSVKRGLYARRLGGGQVNIATGAFVFAVSEGYLIEDGRITAPVRGANLIGNGPDVLRRVSLVGDDLAVSDGVWSCSKNGQNVPVGVGCPTVRIEEMTVGGTRIGAPRSAMDPGSVEPAFADDV